MKRLTILMVVFVLASSAFAERRRSVVQPFFPQCRAVEGLPAVTFTRDAGATVAPNTQPLHGIGYTNGLAALDANTLLAAHNQNVYLSTNGGCSWRFAGAVGFDFPPSITAAKNGVAYVWSDNREGIARYASGTLTNLKVPVAAVGLGVDAATSSRVRIGGSDGSIWDSVDSGATWSLRGNVPRQQFGLFYRAAFDPHNLDHILIGTASGGAYLSRDGGITWTSSTGLSATGRANAFNIVISPADPNVAWIAGLDLADDVKGIYRCTDGGQSFKRVIKEGIVTLVNGPTMAAHPSDPNVLYFVFGTYYGDYGTDLYRYDAATDVVTTKHYGFDDIDAIVFSPADPTVMYFGLEVVELTQP
jgi:photosystem II stability/assembly factor-like uncharacterized protein